MRRRQLRTGALLASVAAGAMIAMSGASQASAPRQYVLRHPKREHCRAHYKRKVVTVTKRVHGHKRKVRETICVRRHHAAPKPAPTTPPPTSEPPPVFPPLLIPTPPVRERVKKTREPPPSPCTTTFTGASGNAWASSSNWTAGLPGRASYACIPSTYANAVVLAGSPEAPVEIGAVAAENAAGVALESGALTLIDSLNPSFIEDFTPGHSTVTMSEGVTLALGGEASELGETQWDGPGTLEVPRGTILRMGICSSWTEKNRSRCQDPQPTRGGDGLRVQNFGTIFGAGITLCRDSATRPSRFENEGIVHLKNSASFAGGAECGEAGSVVNGPNGTLGIAQLDGAGCNINVAVPSLVNYGFLKIAACYKAPQPEHAWLEIGSSFSNVGTLDDRANMRVQGDFTPAPSSDLIVAVSDTLPADAPEANYGTIAVSGNAVLAGQLNIEAPFAEPKLGQTYEILADEGSLSGEFTLGSHCVPAEPGVGYKVLYKPGPKGSVTLEAAEVAGC